ncbi:hypothetical protein K7432_006076 [Basidiobolus ranarum]|uniref:NADPH-dependent FMN reductase-like domain-containing protein n=1 Tax=Basidiobolus ranarum TaxID=34480 RepID=A0ABR2W296_9FUNG
MTASHIQGCCEGLAYCDYCIQYNSIITEPFRIVGICGALRKDSWNAKLLLEAQRLVPEGSVVRIIDWSELPIYNGDLEEPPKTVIDFKNTITAPPTQPYALMSARSGVYPGSSGSHRAQLHLQQVLNILDTHLVSLPKICATGAGAAFDEATSELTSNHTRQNVALEQNYLVSFAKKLKQ